ncbi:hypothetical protein A5844_000154 [Enterococcus sp. 10A9_DIV0425]|uniref:HD/PDEase domain-containing protein n=1 Tax=Candidatus Enterococcus wittei TaxID=1987383 RepID=A0A2C9XP45_9ENTE|nr:HD domain-containing protein [Enterococcus sp. 10A9_DIV0425]OTP11939.1 hypothetical protein A5844_000154 [Enterococcus sp. 10A9_DIV0425]
MDQLKKIASYSEQQLKNDQTGHGADHTNRVVKLAQQILGTEPQADPFITLVAAYLHDIIDDKVVSDIDRAKAQLRDYLVEINLTKEQIESVFFIIENISFSKSFSSSKHELTLEGKIVQDADRLDAIGAIGILRTAYFGGGHGHPIFDPTLLPTSYTDKETYRKGSTVINHFYEKLLLLADQMNTVFAKKEAKRRERFMTEFLEEFFQEWSVDDPKFTPENWLSNKSHE